MSIESTLDYLLHQSEPFACLVKGPWGVGKTYFVNKFIEANGATFKHKTFSYCSLFGANSLTSIERTIGINTTPLCPQERQSFKNKNQKRGLSFRTARCTFFFATSDYSKSILYDSDIRLHLPKLHRISRLDVFSHALNFS